MPRIKQVSTRQNRQHRVGFEPPHRAVKSVRNTSPQRLPVVPARITQLLSSANPPRRVPRTRAGVSAQTTRFAEYSIPKRVFQRLCRDIAYTYIPDCRFSVEALLALQTAMEDFMVGFFEDAALCMRHAKRKTLLRKDMELVAKLRKIEYESVF